MAVQTRKAAQPLWQVIFFLADGLRESASEVLKDDPRGMLNQMTVNQVRIIVKLGHLLKQHPEGVSLKLLAANLKLSPAATSEMVDSLVRKGWLSREVNSADRRSIAIKLSPCTENTLLLRNHFFDRVTDEFLAGVPPEKLALLEELLEDFLARISPR